MARFALFLLVVGLVASTNGQLLQDIIDGITTGWQIAPGVSIRPTFDFDPISVGVEVRIEFKRSVSQPTKEGVFSRLDIDGDGSLSIEEWHAHKGGVVNFSAFLSSVDTDGNEEISWAEFQTVQRVYIKN
ncbi:uncharacterized protein LOC119744312 [Patiria miniata]|uniref:EF-hand domain-containing protein n=1 Tax=Patiria miniata TaxID=46514 RepID=A0A914BJM2_PATMI|nr:uncharacterized protein LOC119744312 [Patiria miniata]